MSFEGGKMIWLNRRMVPWEQATVHVLSHALHYGSSVFEGIRVYKTPDGPKVLRLNDHMRRLFDSATDLPYAHSLSALEELIAMSCKEVVLANELMNGAYIRPIAMRGYGDVGLWHPNRITRSTWLSLPGNGVPTWVPKALEHGS